MLNNSSEYFLLKPTNLCRFFCSIAVTLNQLIIMKKITLLITCLFTTTLMLAQFEGSKQIFESPKLVQLAAEHKTVAILPFKASI